MLPGLDDYDIKMMAILADDSKFTCKAGGKDKRNLAKIFEKFHHQNTL